MTEETIIRELKAITLFLQQERSRNHTEGETFNAYEKAQKLLKFFIDYTNGEV